MHTLHRQSIQQTKLELLELHVVSRVKRVS